MKRLYISVFVFLFVATNFTSCGKILGAELSNSGKDNNGSNIGGGGNIGNGSTISGRTYGYDWQAPDGQLVRNFMMITFENDGNRWRCERRQSPANEAYDAMAYGTYTYYSDTRRAMLRVEWTDGNPISDEVGHIQAGQVLDFRLRNENLLTGPGDLVEWHRLR